MRRSPDIAIAILAKAPVPGFAKTRLIPALGPEGAATLQQRLTAHAVATACRANLGKVTLWAAPDEKHPSFQKLAAAHPISLKRQPDNDLGGRMLAATLNGPTLVVGTDCPALTADHLRACANALRDGLDAVVIPADDGGYVLIGTSRPIPQLFTDMAWSTSTVMTETRRRAAQLGLSWREPAKLWDVDVPEDLERLRESAFGELMLLSASW